MDTIYQMNLWLMFLPLLISGQATGIFAVLVHQYHGTYSEK